MTNKVYQQIVKFFFGATMLVAAGTAQSVDCSAGASPFNCTGIYSSIITIYLDRGGFFRPAPVNQVIVILDEAEPEMGGDDCMESPSGRWTLYMPYDSDTQKTLYSTLLAAKAMAMPVGVLFDSSSCEISTVSFGDSPYQ